MSVRSGPRGAQHPEKRARRALAEETERVLPAATRAPGHAEALPGRLAATRYHTRMQLKSRAIVLALTVAAASAVACSGNIGDPQTNTETPSTEPFAPAASPVEDTGSGKPGDETAPAPGDEPDPATEDAATPIEEDAPVAEDTGAPSKADTAVPAPVDTGVVVDSAPPPPPPPPVTTAKTEFAPYFYTWGWNNSAYPFTTLVDMKKKTSVEQVTLGFVTAPSGCAASRTIPNHKSDLDSFRALGGKLKASFGGASGTYIENSCTTSSSLTTAIAAFVDETGITDLDFDVEQAVAMNATVNTRRSAALAALQKSKGVKISFTLPAMPNGMTSASNAVVKAALAAGVTISHVNLMVMDYGETYSSGKKMGDLAISAVNACADQLQALIPGLTDAAAYRMIGATPMIGVNDVRSEVFSLDDARSLIAFAKAKQLGLVSFWAIQRDVPCSGALDLVLCSGAQTSNYQFSSIFRSVL